MKILNTCKTLFLLFAVVIISGCNSLNTPLLPANPPTDSVTYLIGPGDNLRIFVWRNPDISTSVTVRPDGRISAPLIEELVVSGMTPTAVAKEIETTLSTYIRNPEVAVIVSGFRGDKSQKIRIIGNATNPKTLAYSEGMTLLDVMISVKGLTDFADGDNAQLIRMENGEEKQYTVQLDSLIRGGDINKNRAVYPGDTIIIPESWF